MEGGLLKHGDASKWGGFESGDGVYLVDSFQGAHNFISENLQIASYRCEYLKSRLEILRRNELEHDPAEYARLMKEHCR